MEPSSWGPSAWAVLHKSALHADQKLKRDDWASFVEKFLRNLPCDQCQEHASLYLKTHPQKASESAFEWTVKLHNHVNERLSKPQFEVSQAQAFWSQDKCTQSCSKKSSLTKVSQSSWILVILLGCLAWTWRAELRSWWTLSVAKWNGNWNGLGSKATLSSLSTNESSAIEN